MALLRFTLAALLLGLGLGWGAAPLWAGALDEMRETMATDDVAAGLAAHGRGDHDGAIRRYSQAIESGSLSKPNLAVAYNNRANALEDKGQIDLALADYDQAVKLDPAFGEAFYNRAYALYRLGRFDLAIEDYGRVLTLTPDNASAYFNRSFAWAAKGQFKQAVADVEKALRLSPYNTKYREQLEDWKAGRAPAVAGKP